MMVEPPVAERPVTPVKPRIVRYPLTPEVLRLDRLTVTLLGLLHRCSEFRVPRLRELHQC